MARFLVTIETEAPDLLRRVDLLNASIYRILQASDLIRVDQVDYQHGTLSAIVEAPNDSPMITEGEVTERFQRLESVA